MTKTISVGFDMGMGALKLFGEGGGLQLVSQVATNGRDHLSDGILGLRNRKRPTLVSGDFGSFYVGDYAHENGRPVENMDFERLIGSPEIKALLYAALAKYQAEHGLFPSPISLMVGLPLQMMTGNSAKDYQKGVRSWLKGIHRFVVDGTAYEVEIEDPRQTSQPVGALFDFVLDRDGRVIPERGPVLREEVGIVSVGFNTVELLVVREQRPLERFTRGNTLGVRRLLELINRDDSFSLAELDSDLRAGNLRAKMKQAMPIWSREVNGEIEKVWGRFHSRFSKVLIVGGGALLLNDSLTSQFGHKAWIPDDAVLSIARGLWKLSVIKK